MPETDSKTYLENYKHVIKIRNWESNYWWTSS